MPPVLLALRALGIGDLLTAVPALRALRRAHPEHQLVLAAPPDLAPLAAASGAVDRLLPTRAHVRAPIERLHWSGPPVEIAVNLHGRGPQSHRALLGTRPGRLLAYANRAARWLDGPRWNPREHEVARWCRLLEWYGIPADPTDLVLPTPAPVPQWSGAVVLHPGASGPERRWPIGRYAALARALTDDGYRVLVSGSPAETAQARALARAARLSPAAVLAGRTDVASLAALVAHAALVVCGDTGVAHLATAYRTRSVVLFGPVSPAEWGPPPRPRHAVLWHGPGGLAAIAVAEVYAAALAQLSEPSDGDALAARATAAGGAAATR